MKDLEGLKGVNTAEHSPGWRLGKKLKVRKKL
jgi:hypothetical protein